MNTFLMRTSRAIFFHLTIIIACQLVLAPLSVPSAWGESYEQCYQNPQKTCNECVHLASACLNLKNDELEQCKIKTIPDCNISKTATLINNNPEYKKYDDPEIQKAIMGVNYTIMGLVVIISIASIAFTDNSGCVWPSDVLMNVAGLMQSGADIWEYWYNHNRLNEIYKEAINEIKEANLHQRTNDIQLSAYRYFLEKEKLQKEIIVGKIIALSLASTMLMAAGAIAAWEAGQPEGTSCLGPFAPSKYSQALLLKDSVRNKLTKGKNPSKSLQSDTTLQLELMSQRMDELRVKKQEFFENGVLRKDLTDQDIDDLNKMTSEFGKLEVDHSFLKQVQAENRVVMVRPINPEAYPRINQGAATKNKHVKSKSGPLGLIPVDQTNSPKVRPTHKVKPANAEIESLLKDNKHFLPERTLSPDGKHIAVVDKESFTITYKPLDEFQEGVDTPARFLHRRNSDGTVQPVRLKELAEPGSPKALVKNKEGRLENVQAGRVDPLVSRDASLQDLVPVDQQFSRANTIDYFNHLSDASIKEGHAIRIKVSRKTGLPVERPQLGAAKPSGARERFKRDLHVDTKESDEFLEVLGDPHSKMPITADADMFAISGKRNYDQVPRKKLNDDYHKTIPENDPRYNEYGKMLPEEERFKDAVNGNFYDLAKKDPNKARQTQQKIVHHGPENRYGGNPLDFPISVYHPQKGMIMVQNEKDLQKTFKNMNKDGFYVEPNPNWNWKDSDWYSPAKVGDSKLWQPVKKIRYVPGVPLNEKERERDL